MGWFSACANPRTSTWNAPPVRVTSPKVPARISTRCESVTQLTRQIAMAALSYSPAARSLSFRVADDSAPAKVRLSTANPSDDCTSLAVKPDTA
jgi:hypothetical protein